MLCLAAVVCVVCDRGSHCSLLPTVVGLCCSVIRGGRDAVVMYGLQDHSCAVLSSGAVLCWGFNAAGQVIVAAVLRGGWVCVGSRFAADEMISAGW